METATSTVDRRPTTSIDLMLRCCIRSVISVGQIDLLLPILYCSGTSIDYFDTSNKMVIIMVSERAVLMMDLDVNDDDVRDHVKRYFVRLF
jgi:hypothetical protein